ncbi:MAG TPA: hypothetical protein VF897_07440, partial [Roseiflexaceae bacterium]
DRGRRRRVAAAPHHARKKKCEPGCHQAAGFSEERLPDGSQQAVGRRLRKYVEFGIRPVRRRKHHRFY